MSTLSTTLLLALALSSSLTQAASSLADAELALLDDLKVAEQQLNATERSISNERTALATTLNQAEREISNLREETAASRRLADEATLSIQQLEERLDNWEEQSFFQQNLLGRFNQQASGGSWSLDTTLAEKITWLEEYISEQQSLLYPSWQSQDIILPTGELAAAEQLVIGPVSWFWEQQTQTGGFITLEEGRHEVSLLFDNAQNDLLGELYNQQQGQVIFDPTLSRALRLAQERESIFDHIEKGGLWAFPILLFAAFALCIALLKSIRLWSLPSVLPDLVETLQKTGSTQVLNKVQGMQKELVTVTQTTNLGQARDDRLFATLMDCKHRLEYWLGAIAITAAVSPLLGLLGTVSGMIEAFRLMTIFGAGDPAAVSSGISEALVTTELGLIVAIPSLVLHALLSRRVKSYYGQLENSAVKLSQLNLGKPPTNTPTPLQGVPA